MKDFIKYDQKNNLYSFMIVAGYILNGIAVIFFLTISIDFSLTSLYCLISFLAAGIILVVLGGRLFKNLSNKFKNEYLPDEIKKIYPDCKFDPKSGFDQEELVETKVIQSTSIYHSEDLMYGTYDSVSFRSADVKLQEVRSTGKSVTVVTVFLGRVYEFSFNKNFRSNILINQPNLFSGLSTKRIKMESAEFNSELAVYSDNKEEAFYILTPHFMERLLVLDRKYTDEITFSFMDNKLYIAINNGINTFELQMFTPIDKDFLSEYTEQLNDIKDFVKDLKLDEHLFKE